MALFFVACSDDDSFSTSRNDVLSFSVDTLSMDTLFSGVPSSTKSFWVYNRNSEGLRLAKVRLKRGYQSGFRVNVDGSFLDNSNGSQIGGLELRKKDSLRVFVELTSRPNGGEIPMLVEDELVFTLESGVEQVVNLRAWSWDALMHRALRVRRDTVIQSSKPIIIFDSLRVDSGVTLTIKAPTTLYFHRNASLQVYGTLLVCSDDTSSDVVMRGDRTDRMFDYLPYDRVSGQWKGIRFHASSTGNRLCQLDLHSAETGILCDFSAIDEQKVRLYMENVTIHNCAGYGLKTYNTNVWMANCQITNTKDDCVAFIGGKVLMAYCTLAQFYPFDADRGVALRFTNFEEKSNCPLLLMECYNTLVTGYSDDEIMGEVGDTTVAYNYYFSHCILRTPAETDSTKMAPFDKVIWESPKDTLQGKEHFFLVDADRQDYDFRLSSRSTARGQARPITLYPADRLGNMRKSDTPDIGCYEFLQPPQPQSLSLKARKRR